MAKYVKLTKFSFYLDIHVYWNFKQNNGDREAFWTIGSVQSPKSRVQQKKVIGLIFLAPVLLSADLKTPGAVVSLKPTFCQSFNIYCKLWA